MKCKHCGFENKNSAKFCTKCGEKMTGDNGGDTPVNNSNSTKYIIIALIVVIIILVAGFAYFAGTMHSNDSLQSSDNSQNNASTSQSDSSSGDDAKTQSVSSSQSSSSQASESKSWELIGTYSGSGSGSQTINVPAGKIMVKLSAYPIKNYATNHLYVSGSNGQSGGVDWGSHSDVETRSDSFTYTSSSSQTFEIDYYETVSWQVDFYRYQ
ncbi:MAG: zinc ribbon domain-containing protein [Methanobrevibacter sp.]|uniref:zinc ribbon domain-containing protein n=1 Tax=Methanobrevibacter sp. TaxID=66852 RepID=UPI0025CC0AC1|nr:zinc ribbon domain-containing protein [Methanobrevibacter sp.]MBQ6099239.1 zinc ribbon domain-containing protein [Methanobrevibacter sp.]